MRLLIGTLAVVVFLASTATTATATTTSAHNKWLAKWQKADNSVYPAIHIASRIFGVSEVLMRGIAEREGGNVNPRTLRVSLCSLGGTGWNLSGSDAFGPFQFMLDRRAACMDSNAWGTFGAYDDSAFSKAKQLGTPVPHRYKHPASNVGQAITAAYVLRYVGIGPWCASSC